MWFSFFISTDLKASLCPPSKIVTAWIDLYSNLNSKVGWSGQKNSVGQHVHLVSAGTKMYINRSVITTYLKISILVLFYSRFVYNILFTFGNILECLSHTSQCQTFQSLFPKYPVCVQSSSCRSVFSTVFWIKSWSFRKVPPVIESVWLPFCRWLPRKQKTA